jgi:hypothetical protein
MILNIAIFDEGFIVIECRLFVAFLFEALEIFLKTIFSWVGFASSFKNFGLCGF